MRGAIAAAALGAIALVAAACAPPHVALTRTYTYSVAVEGTVWSNVDEFRASAARVFNDHRSWHAAGIGFQEVGEGGDFTLVPAKRGRGAEVRPGCSEHDSCRVGRDVIINDAR